jgi:hypothetical protein
MHIYIHTYTDHAGRAPTRSRGTPRRELYMHTHTYIHTQTMLEELRREVEALRAENRALKEALQTSNPELFASLDLTPRALLGYSSAPGSARASSTSAPSNATSLRFSREMEHAREQRDRSVPLRSARATQPPAAAAAAQNYNTRSVSNGRSASAHRAYGSAEFSVKEPSHRPPSTFAAGVVGHRTGRTDSFFPPVKGANDAPYSSGGNAPHTMSAYNVGQPNSSSFNKDDYIRREKELLAELETNAKYSYFDSSRVDR